MSGVTPRLPLTISLMRCDHHNSFNEGHLRQPERVQEFEQYLAGMGRWSMGGNTQQRSVSQSVTEFNS